MSPGTAAAMSGVPVDQAGVGSAVVNTSRQVGGSIGIALIGAIMASEIAGQAAPEAVVHARSVAFAVAAAIALAGALIAPWCARTPSATWPTSRPKAGPA